MQEKGILKLGDLLDENNDFIIKSKLRELNISPLEAFRLMSVIDALPLEWRGKLKPSACGICNETFVIQDQCKLILNSEVVQIKSVVPKAITKELRSRELFGMFSCDDELYVNHILLLARDNICTLVDATKSYHLSEYLSQKLI